MAGARALFPNDPGLRSRFVSFDNICEKVFIDGTGAAAGPKAQQVLKAVNPLLARQWGLVLRKAADDPAALDTHHYAVFGSLQPDSRIGESRFHRLMVFDKERRSSGNRLTQQKILHRFPEEDWRMQSNRFVAGKPL